MCVCVCVSVFLLPKNSNYPSPNSETHPTQRTHIEINKYRNCFKKIFLSDSFSCFWGIKEASYEINI